MSKRTNEQWLSDLRASGLVQESALADLRAAILAGLPYALANWLSPDHPQFSSLAETVTQETLLRVLARLDAFEGRSQFTTWAHKIAVRIALTELRHQRWKDVSLESLLESEESEITPGFMADSAPSPETMAEQADMMAHIQRMIAQELTDKQRRAMMAVGKGMPLEEAAHQMGMERNALYKLLHDGRVRLKKRMEREGLTSASVLAVFEQG
jgi:RNA polymerase sigma-70 factor (ECF subfamily)